MTINKLVSPKNRFSSIYGATGNRNYDTTSRGLATDRGSGFLAGGPSHHPCATDGLLLEKAHGIFRSGIPGRRGLYGSGQLGDRFGRRRSVWLLASMCHHDFEFDGDPASAFVHQAGG